LPKYRPNLTNFVLKFLLGGAAAFPAPTALGNRDGHEAGAERIRSSATFFGFGFESKNGSGFGMHDMVYINVRFMCVNNCKWINNS